MSIQKRWTFVNQKAVPLLMDTLTTEGISPISGIRVLLYLAANSLQAGSRNISDQIN